MEGVFFSVTICLVDTASTGHHYPYYKEIMFCLKEHNFEFFSILPSDFPVQGEYSLDIGPRLNIFQYALAKKKYLDRVFQIANKENARVVHFLTGDSLYQLGGIGLSQFEAAHKKILITQHSIPQKIKRKLLLKFFFNFAEKVVVHSESCKMALNAIGISQENTAIINYPTLHQTNLTKKEAREKLHIFTTKPVLLSIGGTRFNKGLDILLEALTYTKTDFLLIIAGKEEFFTEDFIRNKLSNTSSDFFLKLENLSDNEFSWFCDAADALVIPYRKSFFGASGPMTEAVWRRLPVIGPQHGNLGDSITENDLGYTFETENPSSLAFAIDECFKNTSTFYWSKKAECFREKISSTTFRNSYLSLYRSLINTP